MYGLLFKLPWILYLIASGVVYCAAAYFSFEARKLNEYRAQALLANPPALVDEAEVDANSFTDAKEILVSSQVFQKPFLLSRTAKNDQNAINQGKDRKILFGLPSDAVATPGEIKIVYVLSAHVTVEEFVEKFATGAEGTYSPVLNVGGVSSSPSLFAKAMKDAAADTNLTLSPVVQVIEPFMQGRETGLAKKPVSIAIKLSYVLATLLAVYGILRYYFTVRRMQSRETPGTPNGPLN